VVTTDKEKRSVSMFVLKDRARAMFKNQLDTKVSISDPPMIEGTGNSQIPIQIDVRGNTYDDIYPIAQQIGGYLRNTQGVQDVKVNFTPGRPELQLEIDRQKAADLGIFVSTIAMNMRTAMEGEEAGNYRDGKDEIPIRVRMDEKNRASESELGQLQLTTQKGPIPLKDIARFVRKEGPQVIEREARARQILVTASVTGSRSLGDIVNDVLPKIEAIKMPAGASLYYDSAIKMMRETNQNMGLAMLLGLVFVYMVLASQFESFIHPFTIMVTVPLAIVGAIIGLFLSHNTIAMGSLIGMILLVGLVTKNAILLIDRAIVRVREHGDTPMQAVLEAGPQRLRPILMTSAAMVLGMLPTAIGAGEGSEFRAPMAIAVIGGVISSTFLSLLVVPAIYVLIENLFQRNKRNLPATVERTPVAAE
jgi:multidrug efflux pump subunit AcrB